MELRLQPKPEVEFLPANQGIVSRKQFFVKKKFEKINQYFYPAHLIRNWKPKAELIYPPVPDEAAIRYECDFNREVQNCFVEDYAEEVFLRTPPPCFVVFGKVNREVNALCQNLAKEYGSVLIQADDIVSQVLKKDTETSKIVDRLLRLGISLTLNFVLALMSFMAHTTEARQRGYVLSGLPSIPLLEDLPVEKQFDYLFTWENKPTVFIHVTIDDEDLIKQRTSLRIQTKGYKNYRYLQYYSLDWEGSEEEESEEEDDMLPIKEDFSGYERDINVSPSCFWAQLPKDEESQVWNEFELFNNIINPEIKLLKSRVDPQYLITVDSRVKNEFEIIKARLNLLQVWKVPTAKPFIPLKILSHLEGEEEEVELKEEEEKEEEIYEDYFQLFRQIVDEPPQTAFLTLFTENVVSSKFRWELSHYNYVCPVTLRMGEVVEGKSKFAVGFMKYIYFLRDKKSMIKFIQSPRAYVLPIRPKPLCRFFILGLPFTGKTTLAKALAQEFSIPLIDMRTVLKDDLNRKKTTYLEFCEQKAECREITRLTALAWQDWRIEEDRRVNLIEDWILYIQSLLHKRIEQFYSSGSADTLQKQRSEVLTYSTEEEATDLEAEASLRSGESGEKSSKVQRPGTVNQSSRPSAELLEAVQQQDYDFKKNGLDTEANTYFSSFWESFSSGDHHHWGQGEEFGEYEFQEDDEDDRDKTINWCNLLPPQSLSSFLLSKKPYTTREKRQSFKVFLKAASKAYWAPSALKTEFVKWRLPCFMDIPLCEVYLDNPILLLKYVPGWLQERPLIPDPIDSSHPSVVNAKNEALKRTKVVNVHQSEEEMGILLRDAIEKAEREGMRVSGDVMSPGGWVVDNMSLDLNVWNKLACENVFADHIYILLDTEPEYRRIVNLWWKLHGGNLALSEDFSESTNSDFSRVNIIGSSREMMRSEPVKDPNSLVNLLTDKLISITKGEEDLDEIFGDAMNLEENSNYFVPMLAGDQENTGSLRNFQKIIETRNEDGVSLQSLSETIVAIDSERDERFPKAWEMTLGIPLEIVTSQLLNYFKRKSQDDESETKIIQSLENGLQFFIFLLSLPQKLQQLKNWLTAAGRGDTIHEVVMTGETPETVFSNVRDNLMEPFIKKPRALEPFEIEEIQRSMAVTISNSIDEENPDAEPTGEDSDGNEDVRIFGESGELCVVNLERDIFLLGKLEHSLRYYGKLYYFWNEDAKNKFIENPEKYAPYYSAIRCYPPLRIFITGPAGAGKTTLAKSLSKNCGLPVINYPKFLNQKLLPHLDKNYLNALTDQKLLLSDDHNTAARVAVEQFLKAPVTCRQFWFDNSTYAEFLNKNVISKKIKELQESVVYQDFPELTYFSGDFPLENEDSFSVSLEVPFTSMKEVETTVDNYIYDSKDLTDYCVERTLKKLWTTEPYVSQGFVLESFPLRSFDTKPIIENNWIPDVVVELQVPEGTMIDRNIDDLMDTWDMKLKREMIQEKLLEETLANIQKILLNCRRKELLDEKRAGFQELEIQIATTESSRSFESNENDSDVENSSSRSKFKEKKLGILGESFSGYSLYERAEAEAEAILEKEFFPLVFNPNFETYDAGKARIIENLITNYRRDSGEMDKVKSVLSEAGVSWVGVDGTRDADEIFADLTRKLNVIRKRVIHKGEFAFTMSMKTAEKLLEQGYYFLSKFGRWCPVQVYRMKNPIHMFRPYSKRGKITPIAYRNYIYFVSGENEKNKFIEDPIKYTFNEPHHPNIPLRVAVIGPPKSGKTTLSTRLGLMFDLKVITLGSALRFVLEKNGESTLAKSINGYLKRGCFLPLSLKLEALMVCLFDPSCATQGFVFDGIPFDAALTQSLAERGKLPFVIISLVGDAYFGKTNREGLDLTQFRLPYKNRVNLDKRYEDWNATYKKFVQWNQATYSNLYEVNADLSVVDVFYQAYDIIRKSYFGILYYVEYCVSNRVLPLQYLCVSQQEFDLRKSELCNNCPVCWLKKSLLSNSSNPPPRSGLVQYKKQFYWICSEHMDLFVKNPKIYLPPNVPKWPDKLPMRISFRKVSDPDNLHGFGRCPVTRVDFPGSLNWEGSKNFTVKYGGEVFLCKNENMLSRFLMQPWRYSQADTKFEVNRHKSRAVENLGPPVVTSLPPIGFLEQTVANLIHECLQLLGTVRPVYPSMSPSVTGCVFIALYLKAHNKRNKNPQLEKQYLSFMLKSCTAFTFKARSFGALKQMQEQLDTDYDDYDSESKYEFALPGERPSGSSRARFHFSRQDFDKNAETQMWGAKKVSDKYAEMKLTSDDKLVEIPTLPKVITVLKYELPNMRPSPIPPVTKCLNFIYSVKPPIRIPEEFNCDTLYHPPAQEYSAFKSRIKFNPKRQFSLKLSESTKKSFSSQLNLHKGRRTDSRLSLPPSKPKTVSEIDISYMLEQFLPRFQLLDKIYPVSMPPVPKVLPEEAIIYDPPWNYTYAMLLSEFFGRSHFLRCFNWNDHHQFQEYSSYLTKNLELTDTQVEFFHKPRRTASMRTSTSIESFQRIFDAACTFVFRSNESGLSSDNKSSTSSTYNFIQSILTEKLEEIFETYMMNYSGNNFEFIATMSSSESPEIIIRETPTFPPFPWDIICRPYAAYRSINSIFKMPTLENITHERRYSLLDGIQEPNENLKFLTSSQIIKFHQENKPCDNFGKAQFYLYYDFFNMPWTSFLVYPFHVVHTHDIAEGSQKTDSDTHFNKKKFEQNAA